MWAFDSPGGDANLTPNAQIAHLVTSLLVDHLQDCAPSIYIQIQRAVLPLKFVFCAMGVLFRVTLEVFRLSTILTYSPGT